MMSSLRYATNSASTVTDADVSDPLNGAPNKLWSMSMGSTFTVFTGGTEILADGVAAGSRTSSIACHLWQLFFNKVSIHMASYVSRMASFVGLG